MGTPVDPPGPLVRELKLRAAKRRVPLRAIIQEALVKEIQGEFEPKAKITHPLIPAQGRRPYNLSNTKIERLLAGASTLG